MRFFRLFWIPEGKQAIDGTYVQDRYEDLVRILALESVRHRVVVVGEDLGTVEPYIRKVLERYGVLSYRLFYFEKHKDGSFRRPKEYPRQALVSSTTHDLPTLAGFWSGRDIEARWQAGVLPEEAVAAAYEDRRKDKQRMLEVLFSLNLLPDAHEHDAAKVNELTGELHHAILGFLAQTPSMLMVLNQEDITKEPDQQNLPGTTDQHPNWSRKARYSLEELQSNQLVADCAAMLRDWLGQTRRLQGERVAG
jgi:4-alpha-glucanotransferase